MLRPLLLSLTVLATALAGCSDGGTPKADGPGASKGLEPTADTGILQGVVVDEAVRPLAGAKIAFLVDGVAKELLSDDTGFFGTDGLAPGTYFLSASKVGYDPVQQSAEVVAGDADPPMVKILLVSNPALRPYSETFTWNGFLQCSAGLPVGVSLNPCFVFSEVDGNLSSNVWEKDILAGATTVQAEMVWKPATAVGSSFLLSAFVPNEDVDDVDGVTDYAEAQGGSPLILRADGDLLAEHGVGSEEPLGLRVFPGQDQPTAFANQAFEVFITVFYGLPAPEDWTYIEDGAWVYDDADA